MKRIREPQHPSFRRMVRDLIKGLNGLEAVQTRLKRNNARERVVYAIRGFLRVLDSEYPRIAAEVGVTARGRRRLTAAEREQVLVEQGFVECAGISVEDLTKFTFAGVPMRKVNHKIKGKTMGRPSGGWTRIWVKDWAVTLKGLPGARLRECVNSPNARKVAFAEAALRKP